MKRYPKELLALWPQLSRLPFDSDSKLAQSFVEIPAPNWKKLRIKRATALGWAVSRRGYGRLDNNELAWVNHLIASGADVYEPLTSPPSAYSSFQDSFYTLAWQGGDRQLVDVMLSHGLPLFLKHWVQIPFSAVVKTGRLDWVDEFLHLSATGGSSPYAVADAFWGAPKGAVLAEVVPFLRKKGLPWHRSSFDTSLAPLWQAALLHPEHPSLLEMAKQCWDDTQPSEPPCGWGARLGFSLIAMGHEANVEAVRRALESRLTVEQRPAWVPLLPSFKKEADGYGRRGLPQQWAGIWNLVEWSTDWGIGPRQRNEDGVPWGLAIMRKAYKDRDAIMFEFPQDLAWKCLEKLVVTGHQVNAKPLARHAKKRSVLPVVVPSPESLFSSQASLKGFFKDKFNTWQFPQWQERFELALRQRRLWQATEKAWQEAQKDSPAPVQNRQRL